MKHGLLLPTVFVIVMGALVPLRADNLLSNPDFKDDLKGWQGDGVRVFLKPDNTEGTEKDPGVVPVIKLSLSHEVPRFVYQNFLPSDKPTSLNVSVEVFASTDFMRNLDYHYSNNWKSINSPILGPNDWTSGILIPNVDFWCRCGGSIWRYELSYLKPGEWTPLSGAMQGLPTNEDRTLCFCVPPGTGVVCLRKPFAGR